MQQAHEQFGPTLHRMTNFTIESDGVQVRARSYVDALIMPIEAGGPIHRGIGLYQDQFVRTSEGWQIFRHCFHPVKLDRGNDYPPSVSAPLAFDYNNFFAK